jgi:hypothetical protein
MAMATMGRLSFPLISTAAGGYGRLYTLLKNE